MPAAPAASLVVSAPAPAAATTDLLDLFDVPTHAPAPQPVVTQAYVSPWSTASVRPPAPQATVSAAPPAPQPASDDPFEGLFGSVSVSAPQQAQPRPPPSNNPFDF